MRLGVGEVGVTELMGVTEHTRAIATAAAGLLLDSLDSERALVPPLDPGAAEGSVKALLEEIAGWAEAAMGRRVAPVLWRVLAHESAILAPRRLDIVGVVGTSGAPRSASPWRSAGAT
jgi:hypothetical protein